MSVICLGNVSKTPNKPWTGMQAKGALSCVPSLDSDTRVFG